MYTLEDINEMLQEAIQQVQGELNLNLKKISPDVKLIKSSRTYGRCTSTGDTVSENGYTYRENCYISLNEEMLKCDKFDIMNTLVHEVLHANIRARGHNYVWTETANHMNYKYGYNISRLSKIPGGLKDREPFRYSITCADCKKELVKKRRTCNIVKHPERYSCKHCNGNVVINKIN